MKKLIYVGVRRYWAEVFIRLTDEEDKEEVTEHPIEMNPLFAADLCAELKGVCAEVPE